MSRSIVYPVKVDEEGVVWGGASTTVDKYADKLIKYVPAEVLAFFLVATSFADDVLTRSLVIGLGLIVTVAVIVVRKGFRWWTLVLGGVSFLTWVGLTTDYYQVLLALPLKLVRIVLLFLVFFVPLVDEGFTKRSRNS